MHLRFWIALLAIIPAFAQGPAIHLLAEPTINPTREEIAFVSGGDIWIAPLSGGVAHLLVSHPATESRPRFSPDGRMLAFTSTRTGGGDIYVLDLETTDLKRLTYDDAEDALDAWSPDGKYLFFTTGSKDIAANTDIYRVGAQGGTPMPVAVDRYAPEFFSVPSPAGDLLAFCGKGGMAYRQWWRKGHSHIDESEIWIKRGESYERVSGGGAREMWPMWSGDGKKLFFVSDRSGSENVWEKPIAVGATAAARQITQFKDGRLMWPQAGAGAKSIVFERDFNIWLLNTATGRSAKLDITLRGVPAGPATTHLNSSTFQDLALSPDGKKVAVVAHGEIFAASAKDGGAAARVTTTGAVESDLLWTTDSKRLIYRSDRGGLYNLYQYDFPATAETQLTSGGGAHNPIASPDGKTVAYFKDRKELHVIDLASKQDRAVATGQFDMPPLAGRGEVAWSPDSQWLAYLNTDDRSFSNAWVVPAAGGTPKPVSFLANANTSSIQWSPDGKYLMFLSGQRTEQPLIARVDLTPRVPKFREDQFTALFEEPKKPEPAKPDPAKTDAAKPAPKKEPVKIVFEGIRERLTQIPAGLDANTIVISEDGKTLLVSAFVAGQANLYTYSLDELARERPVARQLTSTPGFKSRPQFLPDSKEVIFLETGRIQSINVDSRQTKSLAVTAEMDVRFDDEKREVFRQAWTYIRDTFYDPEFHGLNWESIKNRYEPLVGAARTSDEMRRVIGLMIGELNASHSGISAPFGGDPPEGSGKLGVRFDRTEYEASGRLRIAEVIALSPAAVADIKAGEYLMSVDGTPVSAQTSLEELLLFKTGKRVVIAVSPQVGGSGKRDVPLSPISTAAEKALLYAQWVAGRRDYVSKASGGRLGYVHMPDMSSNSLSKLFLDLDADNQTREGIVIDIRNNNGGFVNVYAIDVFARRGYLHMTRRGSPASVPARTQLGQRSLERPTILVTDMHSLSDAEDFAEGYRTLKLGKVVGEPTAGWIIYTSGTQLIDGSNLRLPFVRITTNEGANMERNPRPVDVPVSRAMGESLTNKDTQLDAAVRELLGQLGRKSAEAGQR